MSTFAASPPEPKSKIPILAKSSSLPEEGGRAWSKHASDLAGDFTRQLNMERDKENKRGHDKGLLALALFKWFKSLVLLLVGVGFFKLLHHDVETELQAL